MNKNKLKTYAQNARREFIKAVKQSAAVYGINEKGNLPCEEKGDFCFINGKDFPKSVKGILSGNGRCSIYLV
jgi:hypothetical protein